MYGTCAKVDPDNSPRDKVRPILRAARVNFLRHGYGATSMEAVARDAGVSKATLYVYFPGKRELFAAIVLEERDRYAYPLPDVPDARVSARAGLLRFARSVVDFLLAPDTVATYRMVAAEAARFPELGEEFHANGPARLLTHVAEHLKRAMAAGVLRRAEPLQAAEHFIGLVRGDLQLLALLGVPGGHAEGRVESVVRRGVDAFLKSYGHATLASSRAEEINP